MERVGAYPMQECEKNNFWRNLEIIKDHLLFDDEEFAHYLGVSSSYVKKRKLNNSLLDLSCVVELTERINVHVEDLFKSDFKLNSSFVNNIYKMNLDPRYNIATHSKTRPIANILTYLEQHVHPRAKLNVFRKFQLTEDFIFNDENNVNIFLITDILNYLKSEYELSDKQFISIGQITPKLSFNKILDEKLSKFQTIRETFDFFIGECAQKFDTNCQYKILQNNQDRILVKSKPNKDVLDQLAIKPNSFGNKIVSLSKMGVISSVSFYNFKTNLPAKMIKSINQGDDCDIYEFNPRIIDALGCSLDRKFSIETIYH